MQIRGLHHGPGRGRLAGSRPEREEPGGRVLAGSPRPARPRHDRRGREAPRGVQWWTAVRSLSAGRAAAPLAAVVVIAALLRLFALGAKSLGLDEILHLGRRLVACRIETTLARVYPHASAVAFRGIRVRLYGPEAAPLPLAPPALPARPTRGCAGSAAPRVVAQHARTGTGT